MTRRENISAFISALLISLMLWAGAVPAQAQFGKKVKKVVEEPDTLPLFRGVALSADLFGPAMHLFGDYGQVEGAVRLNLRDRYFPIVELGYGHCDHVDGATQTSYKTSAPYFRVGVDYNLLKNKHDLYRLYGGVRYAYTNFKYDMGNPGVTDPVWDNLARFEAQDVKCNYHWMELAFGVDATIWGPFHLGWSVRYRNRLFRDEGRLGKCWYVPGFGKTAKSNFGATFNLVFELWKHQKKIAKDTK